MPAAFTKCAKSGGRVRTIKASANRYLHVCFKGKKSYPGEVKTRKRK